MSAGVSTHAKRFTLPKTRRGHRPGGIPDRPSIPRGVTTLDPLPCLQVPLACISPLGDRPDAVLARINAFLAQPLSGEQRLELTKLRNRMEIPS